MTGLTVRPAAPSDRAGIDEILLASWGETRAVAHGVLYELTTLPTVVAEADGRLVGVLTYVIAPDGLEVVSIDAAIPHDGVGTALMRHAMDLARAAGVDRLWLITTNDNLDALRFYQRRGLRITAVHPGALEASRRLKPGIPLVGAYGIPLRDEIVLETAIEH